MNKIFFLFASFLLSHVIIFQLPVFAEENATFSEVEKNAIQGDPDAQFNLGVMYLKGQGVRQDYAKAREWFKKAAAQGVAEAQFGLGLMYDEGQGVRQNKREAKEWFGKACDNGLQKGCDAYKELNEHGY